MYSAENVHLAKTALMNKPFEIVFLQNICEILTEINTLVYEIDHILKQLE